MCEEANVTDDAATLMVSRFERLPPATQEVLKSAACLGARFELGDLASIAAQAPAALKTHLCDAVDQGLLSQASGTESYRWSHDRVQHAAYSLIPTADIAQLHLVIDRRLLDILTSNPPQDRLFYIVNHLNAGASLITDEDERIRLAELNLTAGRRAKASFAYTDALRHLTAGIDLLGAAWEQHHDIGFPLHLEKVQCELLNENPEAAAAGIEELLTTARSKMEQAAVYFFRQNIHMMNGQYIEAMQDEVAGLAVCGLDIPASPERADVIAACNHVRDLLGERPVEAIADLPPSTDPQCEAAMLFSAMSFDIPDINQFAIRTARMVALAIECGNTEGAAWWYAMYGSVLGPVCGDYQYARRFSATAAALAAKHPESRYSGKIQYSVAVASYWNDPIDQAIAEFQTGVQAAACVGDNLFAACSAMNLFHSKVVRGDPLGDIMEAFPPVYEAIGKSQSQPRFDTAVALSLFIRKLQGRSRPTTEEVQFDHSRAEAMLEENRHPVLAHMYWSIQLQNNYLSGHYAEALRAGEKARAIFESRWCASELSYREYCVFYALTLAALFEQARPEQQAVWLDVLMKCRQKVRLWADVNPSTFGSCSALVSAEFARISGDMQEADRLYQESIRWGQNRGCLPDQALACELAARFYLAKGSGVFAEMHLRQARACYARWGAYGKVKDIDATYPYLDDTPPLPAVQGVAQLDALTVIKASQAISSQIVPAHLLDTLMRAVMENAGAQKGYLLLSRKSGLALAVEAVVDLQTIDVRVHAPHIPAQGTLPASLLNYVRRSREKIILSDARVENPFAADAYFSGKESKSVLCLPVLRHPELIGVLYLENDLVSDAFTTGVAMLELLAAQAAISLENAELYQNLAEENSERKRVQDTLQLRDRAIEASINGIMITECKDGHNVIIYVNPAFEKITGYTAAEVTGLTPRLLLGQDFKQPGLEEARLAALERREITTTMRNYRKDGTLFWNALSIAPVRNDAGEATHLVWIIDDATERKRYEEQLERQAYYDPLTALANRNLLVDRLSKAMAYAHRYDKQVAVLLIDLDRFKTINDSLGHATGDIMLQVVAQRLQRCVRETDTVARLGGDEFVVVITEVSDGDHCSAIAWSVLEALRQPINVGERHVFTTASVGISLYPKDGMHQEVLLKNADVAMYRAKDQGGNGFKFYTEEMNDRTQRRFKLESDLRGALARNELSLVYQARVEPDHGAILSAEALVRWEHPEIGMVPPAEFIPLAEETGLITSIGEWVLERVCAQQAEWLASGISCVPVAVNISAAEMRKEGVLQSVRNVLTAHRLDPHYLALELTETAVMQNPEEAARTLKAFRALGLTLSLDDFGTGYSSLAYLRRFPFNDVKIDRTFIANLPENQEDAAIANAIIAMAHTLKLRVVAEGVETAEQLDLLRQLGCDEIQGYYCSRPLSAGAFEALLRLDEPLLH
jgi:diguanylate cyclase (GGDEF)-like protein/PAS domain S-box-containing protein